MKGTRVRRRLYSVDDVPFACRKLSGADGCTCVNVLRVMNPDGQIGHD